MAQHRLALAALVACTAADAQPPATASGVTAPAGWLALPALASAAKTGATAGGVTVDGSEAWGEPAMGCYAVWVALHGSGGDAPALAEQVRAGLAAASIEVKDVTAPGADGLMTLGFAKAPYAGKLRARLGSGKIAALACFGNGREPKACERACDGVLGAMR